MPIPIFYALVARLLVQNAFSLVSSERTFGAGCRLLVQTRVLVQGHTPFREAIVRTTIFEEGVPNYYPYSPKCLELDSSHLAV